jgi:hypothetical protein
MFTPKHPAKGMILVMAALLAVVSCSQPSPSGHVNSVKELISLFPDPPSEYRSAPLWDWNEQITEEGIGLDL